MCGRFSDRFTWKELHDLANILFSEERTSGWTPKYNIAPTTEIPVIRFIDGARRIDMMRWGLVASWSKEIGKIPMHNARADGCTEKPTFRGAWKAGRRCIIPASSFFEWRKSDKKPFAIGMGNGGIMGFAGLWEEWKPKDGGAPLLSCTIITTGPNTLVAPIHDRMPVILGEEDWPAWLGEEPATQEELVALLSPFTAERMTVWEVDKAVGNVKNQGESLIEPVKPLI